MSLRNMKKTVSLILAVLMAFSSLSVIALAADEFETQIAAFPSGYKTYLRQLHEKYPNWVFQAVETGINWSDAVKNENIGETSLVSTAASDAFKSHDIGDYTPSTDTYKQYDAGFVRANSFTVGYYMDPRNFLNERGIFQFEQLSFSSSITVSVVEQVLKGSFMSNKKITYYDTKGKQHTLDVKYSEAIYNAGKKYNVNPCYLASKIINEVGKNGSGSTSGKRSGYEGYYNFYNIGATSGSNPIANGLTYAKGGSSGTATSYQRPWTDPEKAIMGGAEFIASGYISKGQDTGYFQRFNVSPDAVSKTYTHQYMTDISGAFYQSSTTYTTYNSLSLMGIKRVFKIPVYKNLPKETKKADSFSLTDSKNQMGYVNVGTLNVRSQPNTSSAKITAIPYGTQVKILETCQNSDGQYSFGLYPFWFKASFSYNGSSYTGYLYSDSVTLTTEKAVVAGTTFSLAYTSSPAEKPTFLSDDPSVVRVNSDGSLTALKVGSTYIRAYTARGYYDIVKIAVTNGFTKVTGLLEEDKTTSSVSVSWNAVSGASGYEVYTVSSTGEQTLKATVSETCYTFSGLKAGQTLNCAVRAVGYESGEKKYGEMSSSLTCTSFYKAIANLKQSDTTASTLTLKWDKVDTAYKYNIYKCDTSSGKYVKLAETTANEYKLTGLSAAQSYTYKVVARAKVSGTKTDYAVAKITVITAPKAPTGLKVNTTTSDSVTIKWTAVSGAAKYAIYKLGSNGKYTRIAIVKTNSYTASGLLANTAVTYKVKAISVLNGKTYYGAFSSSVTASTGPNKVKNLSVSSVTETSAKLTWSKSTGANGYYIYIYNETTKSYDYVGKSTTTTCTLKNLTAGSSGKYIVKPYRTYNKTKYKGTQSSSVTVKTLPSKTQNLKFTDATKNSYTLKWDKVSGADGYEIYKKQSNGQYKLVATASENSYKFTNLKSAMEATYKVRAYVVNGKKTLYGEYSVSIKVITIAKNVSSLKAEKTSTGFKLTWNEAIRAHGYYIYAYNSKTGKYDYIGSSKSGSYTVKSTQSTKYKVVSYVKCGGVKYKSSGKTVNAEF